MYLGRSWKPYFLSLVGHFRRLAVKCCTLTHCIEHENAYVRAGAAAALSEAVTEHWPQTISQVVGALQECYREKVCTVHLP